MSTRDFFYDALQGCYSLNQSQKEKAWHMHDLLPPGMAERSGLALWHESITGKCADTPEEKQAIEDLLTFLTQWPHTKSRKNPPLHHSHKEALRV